MRTPFGKILIGSVAAALLAAAPTVARPLDARGGETWGPETQPVGIQSFEIPEAASAEVEAPAVAPAIAPTVGEALLAEINFARAYPQDYARRLLLQPVSDWERGLANRTDPAAVAEAIDFLMRQTPLPPLRADDRLAAAALEHVTAQGAAGQTGHAGANGEAFDARLRRHGVDADMRGENIAYGPARPSDVVRELIIDSGVPDRGHRRNIFYATFETAGVSCGPHRDYAAMCVMDFASPATEARPHPKTWTQAALSPNPPASWGLLHHLMSWW
jgi:uncharacterized protein YkwD